MKPIQVYAPSNREVKVALKVPASKSVSNRLLIIQALCRQSFDIHNLSTGSDTQTLHRLIHDPQPDMDAGQGGTTYRFFLAYLAQLPGTWTLRASERMSERPIGALVYALEQIGAEIEFLKQPGHPPVRIHGKKLKGGRIRITGEVSSQFLSALALIAPYTEQGVELEIKGELVSRPYFEMTLKLLRLFGIESTWEEDVVTIPPGEYTYGESAYHVEGDWTSASYWYEVAALSKSFDIRLEGLSKSMLQPDCAVSRIFTCFGVESIFDNGNTILFGEPSKRKLSHRTFDLIHMPDIAQTLAATASGLHLSCTLEGLQTLRIKETDRLQAMVQELSKTGMEVTVIGDHKLVLDAARDLPQEASFHVHNDHRMALSLAPLALVMGSVTLEDAEVVGKSYPEYWDDLSAAGFEIKEG